MGAFSGGQRPSNGGMMQERWQLKTYSVFLLVQWALAVTLCLRFWSFLPEWPSTALGWSFLTSATLSHMGLLVLLLGLLGLPLVWLPRVATQLLWAAGATLGLVLLAVDTAVFAQYRFHINGVVLELLMAGQVVEFPWAMWLLLALALAAVFALQYGLLRWLAAKPRWRVGGRWLLALGVLLFLYSHVCHMWAAANAYQPVMQLKRYLPLFYPATSTSTMRRLGWVDEAALQQQKLMSLGAGASDFHYPLQALQTQVVAEPRNIVFLVIDSWRADAFNAEVTPNLWRYAQRGQVFERHYSGGNATRVGIFGLFYGLPGTYWHAAMANNTSPVLLDRLQALDYELGIFASAQLRNPEFNRTVFAKVPNLREETAGASVVERDQNITAEWLDWYQQRDGQRPHFSFLFYDAPHGYVIPEDYPMVFAPRLKTLNYLDRKPSTDPLPWRNQYNTSVHFVDSLAGQVLAALDEAGELDDTLVVITGDHGEEINDNGLNYWGHNSNFSDVQVRVPFVLLGPGIAAGSGWGAVKTSHNDVAATLLKNYLGVTNPATDYSVGVDLLGPVQARDWLLAAGYTQYAVLTDEAVMEVGAVGQFQHLGKDNRPRQAPVNYAYLQAALEQIRRFSK